MLYFITLLLCCCEDGTCLVEGQGDAFGVVLLHIVPLRCINSRTFVVESKIKLKPSLVLPQRGPGLTQKLIRPGLKDGYQWDFPSKISREWNLTLLCFGNVIPLEFCFFPPVSHLHACVSHYFSPSNPLIAVWQVSGQHPCLRIAPLIFSFEPFLVSNTWTGNWA